MANILSFLKAPAQSELNKLKPTIIAIATAYIHAIPTTVSTDTYKDRVKHSVAGAVVTATKNTNPLFQILISGALYQVYAEIDKVVPDNLVTDKYQIQLIAVITKAIEGARL